MLIQLGSRVATVTAGRPPEHFSSVSAKDSPSGALPPCTIGMSLLYFSSVFQRSCTHSSVLTRKLALDDRDAALLHRHPTPQGAAPGGEGGEGGEEEEKRCNGDPLVINDPHDALPTFSLLML